MVSYNKIMIFDIERKYIILIAILSVGLLAGVFVLFRQKNAVGFAGAQISRVFSGSNQWMEIKPLMPALEIFLLLEI